MSTTLFSNLSIRGKVIKNRIVFPPMVCFYGDTTDGVVRPRNVSHYEKIAKGGVGAVIVEATCISPEGKLNKCQFEIGDDKFIDGLSKIAKVIKENGATALIQIHHAGLRTCPESSQSPASPSGFSHKDGRKAYEMTLDDIKNMQKLYVDAAVRAQKAGFDGIELHGCHAYLISQFMSPTTNTRTDKYGEDKALFGVEILKGIRSAVGDDFIVGVRTSGNDPDFKTSVEYAKAFEAAGADYLHVSTGYINDKPADLAFDDSKPYNWIVQMGAEMKKHVSIPIIAVNGVKTPEQAKSIIENDQTDFVALCKGIAVDNEWPNKTHDGRAVDLCLGCAKCGLFTGVDNCEKKKVK